MKLTLANIDAYRADLQARDTAKYKVMVCCGTGCRARGGLQVA